MDITERVRDMVEPLLVDLELELYDVEHGGGMLKVVVDRAGGVDMEALSEATRRVSRALDEHDPIAGHYTLEVSSPGLERVLRTPAHFTRAIGEKVTIKTVPAYEGERRVTGVVAAADEEAVTLRLEPLGPSGPAAKLPGAGDAAASILRVRYDDIERARTVFEWGPAPKPGKQKKRATT